MPVELAAAGGADAAPDSTVHAGQIAPRHRWRAGLDGFDVAVLAAFAAVSVWVLGIDLWRMVVNGRLWTGTDGLFLTDQMDYLAWIRSSAQHLFAGDLFVLHATPSDYLQPLVVISAALTRLGLAAQLTLLLWKPVSVAAIFFAVRAFVRCNLADRSGRRAALVIGLFGGSLPAIGDLWPGFWSWGYSFSLIGIAAMAGAIVCYSRARERRGAIWLPAALGALAAWLHPWQGEAMILILAVTEGTMWARGGRVPPARRHLVLLVATVLATLAPLLYYVLLAKLDPQWGLARLAGKHVFSLGALLAALAPLIVASAPAYGKSPSGFIATATRVWPLVVLGVFVVSESGIAATPLHAFAGITIPLCVLSVEGARSVAGRQLRTHHWLGPLLIAAVTVPTTIDELRSAVPYISPSLKNGNFITADERRAFRYLAADPQPGGVLARAYLGLITPTFTGRHVYLGACQWSEPNCGGREQLVHRVFETPGISPAEVRAAVLGTRARFVFNSICTLPGKDLDRTLEPIAASVRRFGCAAVYVIRDPRP